MGSHGLIKRDRDEVQDHRPKLQPVFSQLFKVIGTALVLFVFAALFWQWAIYAAFSALIALAAVWTVAVYRRKKHPEG
jgi:membrane protein YdbS with pleckstrin-like domain